MTTVDILFRSATAPSEATLAALGALSQVYGIRSLAYDSASSSLRVEYDATRMNGATVERLVRQAGLEVAEAPPLVPEPAAIPVPAA